MQITDISISGVRNNHLVTGIAVNDVIQTVSGSSPSVGKYFVYLGKHKSITISFTNHQNYQNGLYQANLTLISGTNYSQTLGEHVNFTGNESATIHTGEYEYVMFQCSNQTAYVATVTDITDDMKLVNGYQLDNDLTSVANAIRTKGSTSNPLAFPSGFVSAVEAIPTGGGGVVTPLASSNLRVYYEVEDYIGDGLVLNWYGGNSPTSLTHLYSSQTVYEGSGYVDFTLFTATYTYLILEYSGYKNYGIHPDICIEGGQTLTTVKQICLDGIGFVYNRINNNIYLAIHLSDLTNAFINNGLITYLTASLED